MPAKQAAAFIGFVNLNQRLKKWGAPLLGFAIGQPAVQLVNLLTGFLLLRWLSVEHYAQFGVAFAFQSTVGMLADLGFSASILALAGERARDPDVVGKYLRSARHYRFWLAVAVGTGFALLFPVITSKQSWDLPTKAAILASILAAVAVQAWTVYQAPLLAQRRISQVYQPQIAGGAIRLALSYLLHVCHALSGVAASWIGTLALTASGWWTKQIAKPFVREPARTDQQANEQMCSYLAPLIPGVVFTAVQSHILVLVITVFGSSQNVAEVAALGRLTQVFGLLTAFNGVIIGPYVATLPRVLLIRRYLLLLVCGVSVAALLVACAFLFPSPLLWLLGPNYQNLRGAVGWAVLIACVIYLSGLLWTMNAARRWVHGWYTALYIALTLIVQIVCALVLPLGTTMGVIFLGLATAMAGLLAHGVATLYFLARDTSTA